MSTLLWIIAILLGGVIAIRKLARSQLARLTKNVENFANPQFTTLDFSELPRWARRRFAGLRSAYTALGFRELVIYRRQSERLNYTCMLVTPDGLTLAHVWVARSYGAQRAFSMLMGWEAFKRELLVAPRYSLTTEYSGTRRFDTTMVEFLARSQVDGEIEFLIVPPEMPLAEVVEHHRAGAQAFAAKIGAPPMSITTAEQFFDCERAHIARAAKKLRRNLIV